jgi:hypothetical protein|tara:strand:+ start:771 stop:983 length:213 start_codon:yes stop_codon:yes gene_type:complete
MSVTYDTPEEIALFRIRVLMGALKLETKGMTRRGRSVYAIVKEEFKLKGNKAKVLEDLTNIYKKAMAKRN